MRNPMAKQASVGKLSHRIGIQEATEAADETGQMIQTWTTVRTVWGRYEGTGGREVLSGEQIKEVVTGTVTVRRGMGITADNRLLINGRGLSNLVVQVAGVLPPETDMDRQMILVSQAGT
jgi:SPP1 family predicted phage head-tail adaptor